MNKRGRKPKSISAKKLAGNPGKRPMKQQAHDPLGPKPRKPIGLPYHAGVFWDKLSGPLYEMGVLTFLDVPIFEGLCWSYYLMREAAKILNKDGPITVDERGLNRKHPASQIFRDNFNLLMKGAGEFGLLPMSRIQLNISSSDNDMSLAEMLFQIIDE